MLHGNFVVNWNVMIDVCHSCIIINYWHVLDGILLSVMSIIYVAQYKFLIFNCWSCKMACWLRRSVMTYFFKCWFILQKHCDKRMKSNRISSQNLYMFLCRVMDNSTRVCCPEATRSNPEIYPGLVLSTACRSWIQIRRIFLLKVTEIIFWKLWQGMPIICK